MRLGLGLGLNQRNRKGRSSTPEDTIKTAIKERHHIRAIRSGVSVLIQPYALMSVEGVTVLRGVIVFVDGSASGDWVPSDLDVTSLKNVEIYDETFVPSDAFDASGLTGVIAVIEGIDPFKDIDEGDTGKG